MALPSSGPLSISQIHTALGSSSYSLHTLSVAAGKTTPDAISEFYGYSSLTYVYLYYGSTKTIACSGVSAGYFYINSSDLSTATKIYTNSGGTTYASTAFYSDGSIARSWSSSTTVLAAASACVICFVEGTLITLVNGQQVPIENLYVDQLLMSSNISTLTDTNDVEELYKWNTYNLQESRIDSPIIKIEKQTADQTVMINDGLLEATPFHSQLYKRDGLWRFDTIGSIQIGDYLYDINKNEIEVTSVKFNKEIKTIYPLSLSPSHTYFANNILTHNIK